MKCHFLLAMCLMAGLSFAQAPIDSEEEISIGGIRQFIRIQGDDDNLPLLLFLHGGPGGSVMSYSDRFTDRLKKYFVVVQWDQRDTGRTLDRNESTEPLTVALFQRDTREITEYLLKRFHREKLYLAGHSWGTVLGFYLARTCPELLYAYVAIGPMIDQTQSERLSLALMKERAVRKKNVVETEELDKVHIPFETGEELYYHRKWLLDYSGSRKSLSKEYVMDWAERWLHVFNEASTENLMQSLPSINCPVYFFVGKKDLQTNSLITEKYYRAVNAPKKDLFWFETGHSIPASAPDRFQQILIEKILPETFIIQKPDALISTQ